MKTFYETTANQLNTQRWVLLGGKKTNRKKVAAWFRTHCGHDVGYRFCVLIPGRKWMIMDEEWRWIQTLEEET